MLCKEWDAFKAKEILFFETSTLGVREMKLLRHSLQREIRKVETPYGSVRIKVAYLPNGEIKSAPEYEDCRRLATKAGVPLNEIYKAAQAAFGLDRT
jgi:uncharacterized protein (DUF111 family)